MRKTTTLSQRQISCHHFIHPIPEHVENPTSCHRLGQCVQTNEEPLPSCLPCHGVRLRLHLRPRHPQRRMGHRRTQTPLRRSRQRNRTPPIEQNLGIIIADGAEIAAASGQYQKQIDMKMGHCFWYTKSCKDADAAKAH